MAEAQAALTRCIEIDDKNAEAFRLLAGIMAHNGQFKEAIEKAQSAVNLSPDNKSYQNTLEKIKLAASKSK